MRGAPERPPLARPSVSVRTLRADSDSGATHVPGSTAAMQPLREARAEFEAKYIAEALNRNGYNVSRTAEALGISRPALQEKMKTYHLR